jgi:hypothetical protein
LKQFWADNFNGPANGSISTAEPGAPDGLLARFLDAGRGPWPQTGEIDIMEDVNGLSKTSGTVRCALNELSWSLLECTLRAAPRKALMRSAAMAHRHSASLGADHRRILEAIEDHAAGLGSRQA